ncbi:MAG: hypothetical protein M3541_13675 [Acidobacteriota bacterium]|nr:hypothetical protein [Acidobacteriota bacterium]
MIDTGTDKRYVKRTAKGLFKESDDVSRSLSTDGRKTAKKSTKPGYGDQGEGNPSEVPREILILLATRSPQGGLWAPLRQALEQAAVSFDPPPEPLTRTTGHGRNSVCVSLRRRRLVGSKQP